MRRAVLLVAALGVLAFAGVAGNFHGLAADTPSAGGSADPASAPAGGAGQGDDASATLQTAADPCTRCDGQGSRGLLSVLPDGPWTALSALGAVVGLGALAGWYLRGPLDQQSPPGATDRTDDAGRGRPDRSTPSPPPRNGVEAAWRRLRERVAAADTHTPAEVADRAVERGLDAAAVDEVTALFRRVRYGAADATPARERRAEAARQAVERRLDADAGGTTDGNGEPTAESGERTEETGDPADERGTRTPGSGERTQGGADP